MAPPKGAVLVDSVSAGTPKGAVPESVTEVQSTYAGGRTKPIGTLERVLPMTTGIWREAEAPLAKGAAVVATPMAVISDIAGLPARAFATLRGGKMYDPSAAFLRPEIEKTKALARRLLPPEQEVSYEGLGPVYTGGNLDFPIEVAGQIASDPITYLAGAAKLLKSAMPSVRKIMGSSLGAASGVPSDVVIEAAKTPRRAMTRALRESTEHPTQLIDVIKNFDDYAPYEKSVQRALQNMPPVDISPAIEKLVSQNTSIASTLTGHPAGEAILKDIHDLYNYLQKQREMYGGAIPAVNVREIRKYIDELAGYGKGLEVPTPVETAARTVRKELANGLRKAAAESNNSEYIRAMDEYSAALEARDDIMRQIMGKSDVDIYDKAQKFLNKVSDKKSKEYIKLKNLQKALPKGARQLELAAGKPDFAASGQQMWLKTPELERLKQLPSDWQEQVRLAALGRKLGMVPGESGIPWVSTTQRSGALGLPAMSGLASLALGHPELLSATIFSSPKVAVNALSLIEELSKLLSNKTMPYSMVVPSAVTRSIAPGVDITIPQEE